MKRRIIGLHGAAHSGKDTVADYLVERHGFCKISFAAPLKSMIDALLGELYLSPEEIAHYRDVAKNEPLPGIGVSYRVLAQTLGTEWGRQMIRPDLWVLIAELKTGCLPAIVFSDVRFANESLSIHQRGGAVWLIQRPDAPTPDNAGHASEAGIPMADIDRIILNDEGFDTLYSRVEEGLAWV